MYSINKKTIYLYEINKSKFYSILIPLNNTNEIKDIIDEIKKEYKDATHYCYAYIYDQYKRFSDDGEPGGTAGMPILNVLENNNLNHVLAVVVRYFGGIKLGAGGLVRAYTNSVSEALNTISIVKLIPSIKIKIEFSYDNIKQIDYLLKDYIVESKEYSANIIYILNVPNESNIKTLLNNYIINYQELDNSYIKEAY